MICMVRKVLIQNAKAAQTQCRQQKQQKMDIWRPELVVRVHVPADRRHFVLGTDGRALRLLLTRYAPVRVSPAGVDTFVVMGPRNYVQWVAYEIDQLVRRGEDITCSRVVRVPRDRRHLIQLRPEEARVFKDTYPDVVITFPGSRSEWEDIFVLGNDATQVEGAARFFEVRFV